MKVMDVNLMAAEGLRLWRERLRMGVESQPPEAETRFILLLCKLAIQNADDVGTNRDSLTYPDDLSPVEGLTRLLARQLVWAAREHPHRTDLIGKRSERFQMAVGLPLTKKYDFATATMAFVFSGAGVADVPRPKEMDNIQCHRGACPVIAHWLQMSG